MATESTDSTTGQPTQEADDGRARSKGVRSFALIKRKTALNYMACYREIFVDGELDMRTKELIAIAAASATGCENCLKGHIKKALELGATLGQVKEAVAVAFAVNAATVVDRTDIAWSELDLGLDDEAESNGL